MATHPPVGRLIRSVSVLVLASCSGQVASRSSSTCVPATQELRSAIARQLTIHGQGKISKDLPAIIGVIAIAFRCSLLRGRHPWAGSARSNLPRLVYTAAV